MERDIQTQSARLRRNPYKATLRLIRPSSVTDLFRRKRTKQQDPLYRNSRYEGGIVTASGPPVRLGNLDFCHVTGADNEIAESLTFLTLGGITPNDRGQFLDNLVVRQ